jgi:acyl carrier protein
MELEQELLTYIKTELAQGKPDIGPETNLAGVVDSTAVMEIVVWLEGKYGLEVEVDDITPDNFGTVAALAAYVRKRKG